MVSTNLKTGVRKHLGARIASPPSQVRKRPRRSYPFPFYRGRGSLPWPELVTSGATTVVLFALALLSMRSVSSSSSRVRDIDGRSEPRVTFLTPAKEPERPRPKPAQPRPIARTPAPTAPAPQVVVPVAPAPVPVAPTVDTASSKPAAPPARLTDITVPNDRIEFRPTGPSSSRSGLGSASAPAGLTDNSRSARGAAAMTARDSSLAAWAYAAHDAARWATMSEGTRKEIEQSRGEATKIAQRVGTAGNSGDVHVPTGQGKDGVGAAGGAGTLGSISLPLFSRGKSREQRQRDSVIDAEIRAGLARSAARIAARRDSIRADSIRADSARKVAQSRKPAARRDST